CGSWSRNCSRRHRNGAASCNDRRTSMLLWKARVSVFSLSLVLLCGGRLLADDAGKKAVKELPSFGALRTPADDAARAQSQEWLKTANKSNAATQKAFDELWASDRPLLDKVSGTLALGDPAAAQLLQEARDPETPAPTSVPNLIKDQKLSLFFRANLGLAYAKALTGRKVYDEALEAFKSIKGEDVIDPAAYFFHRAVTEHALMMKNEADDSIDRLLLDVVDAPVRYRMVGVL